MGNKKIIQSCILIFILLITGFLAYKTPVSVEAQKTKDLKTLLGPVEGYVTTYESPLDKDILRFLELDDYTSINYKKAGASIGLYIGYYNSLDKVSAAHSPLICFPGQGWAVDQPLVRRLNVGDHSINYAEMVATLEGTQELVLYWYQAHESTSAAAFQNKINAMINRVSKNEQEHAFVRVTVPFVLSEKEKARQVAIKFIQAFYPKFLSYINDKGTKIGK